MLFPSLLYALISIGSCLEDGSGLKMKHSMEKIEKMQKALDRISRSTYKQRIGVSLETPFDSHSSLESSKLKTNRKPNANKFNSSEISWTFQFKYHHSNHGEKGSCLKAIDWQDASFMACPVDFLSMSGYQQHLHILYKSHDSSEFVLIQIIYETGVSRIKDVDFFVHSNELFMLVAHLSDPSRMIIYRWISPYFYKEMESVIDYPEKLASINHKNHVLVLLVHRVNLNMINRECEIFKFIPGNDMKFSMKRLQRIRMPYSSFVSNFIMADSTFLLISDAKAGTRIYRWEGSKFTFWMEIDSLKQCETTIVGINSQNQTAMIVYSEKRLYVFEVSKEFAWSRKQLFFIETSSIFDVDIENDALHIILITKDGKQHLRRIDISRLFEKPKPQRFEGVFERLNKLREEVEQLKDRVHVLQRNFSSVLLTNEQRQIKGNITCKQLVVRSGHVKQVRVVYPDEPVPRKIQMNSMIGNALKLIRHLSNVSWVPITEMRVIGNLNVLFGQMNSIVLPQLDPVQLLTYNDQQFIRAPLNVTNITVNWLLSNSIGDISIEDLVLKTDSSLLGKVTVNQIECKNISFSNDPIINNINLNDVLTKKSKPLCESTTAGELNASSIAEVETLNVQEVPAQFISKRKQTAKASSGSGEYLILE